MSKFLFELQTTRMNITKMHPSELAALPSLVKKNKETRLKMNGFVRRKKKVSFFLLLLSMFFAVVL